MKNAEDKLLPYSLVEWSGDEHEKFNSRIEAAKHGIEYALDNYVRQINKDK
jgi:hypothetical protein